MKWITSILLVFLVITATAKEPVHTSDKKDGPGIEFHTGSWEEGVDLARKYHIRGYPTMIFLDSKGQVITQITGYRDAEGLIESGKQILSR